MMTRGGFSCFRQLRGRRGFRRIAPGGPETGPKTKRKRPMKMRMMCLVVLAVLLLAGCTSAPPPPPPPPAKPAIGSIVRLDPAFDALVAKDAEIEKVASGFTFTEGPLWRPDGHLWFSDVVANKLRSVTPDGQATVLIDQAGGQSTAPPGSFVGPNGMIADKDGTVLLCQHTSRRIVRIDKDLKMTPVVEKFEGKRLNSPNDLVYKSDGALYFTDPPYGLPKQDEDPAKELKFNGVYRYANGKMQAIVKDLNRPNGLAFSPNEKVLYVANTEPKKFWMRYDVTADGSVSNGRVFADLSAEKDSGGPDGMKVDSLGNIWATGPGGVWVFAPDGKCVGTIKTPEIPANVNWGDDGKTLYITAVTSVYRVKTSVAGMKALYQ
jgi:gluconolactonase